MIVVDASAVLEVLLRTPVAAAVEARIFRAGTTIHAPHLLDVEVAQVLRRYVLSGQMADSRASEALGDLGDLPLTRYPHTLLIARAWELHHNLTAYDAVYVALSEILDAPLLTTDRRLLSAPGHKAKIECLSAGKN